VAFSDFCRLFNYEKNYQLRGFTTVSNEKLESFYTRYDDLYSILMRLRQGSVIAEKPLPHTQNVTTPATPASHTEDVDGGAAPEAETLVSDHVKMQWKLATLGLKAGEKVWVPAADQSRIRRIYEFSEFEPEFATGIDLPKNYFENIDVVWKDEFRIDAAFEVENSTSIYSGLLRFADLNVVAPNTMYPMFIVAPAERRNRVREQLMRPAFRRLDLHDKVKFLTYEAVEDIDRFFSGSSRGLTVEVMGSKAETL
jgi:hypothetical protein